jgi:hypothetical protein
MPLVIPSKSPATEIARLEAGMEAPYAVFRGRGRTHIPFILTSVVYVAREFASGNFSGFGENVTNVTAIGMGYDQKVDDQGRAIFELGKRTIARSGSVKEPIFWEKGKEVQLTVEEIAALVAVPLNDVLVEGPAMKVTWGSDKNVAKTKRSAADSLALSPNSGFPMKANQWVDVTTGTLKKGDDKVDWDKVTGIQSKLQWVLKHHKAFEGTEDYPQIQAMIGYIPFATDSKHALAAANSTPVQAAAANASDDPFAQ